MTATWDSASAKRTSLFLDSSLLLIEPVAAAAYLATEIEAQKVADGGRHGPSPLTMQSTPPETGHCVSKILPSRPTQPVAVKVRPKPSKNSSTGVSNSTPFSRNSSQISSTK